MSAVASDQWTRLVSKSPPIRSRKGCLTCRSKKVKCDEQRSICGRCCRLALSCEWSTGSQSRARAKAQSGAEPRTTRILPNCHHVDLDFPIGSCGKDTSSRAVEDVDLPAESVTAGDGNIGLSSFTVYEGTDPTAIWNDWYPEQEFSADFLDIGDFAAQGNLDEILSDSALESSYHDLAYQSPAPLPWPSNLTSPLNIYSPGPSTQNIVLSPPFSQTAKEIQALQYYKTHFNTKNITKNVLWSTHMVMLRYGSQTPMVMHFLIAASLMNLGASQNYDIDICSAAREHSRAGAYLLIDAVNSGAEPDHISILTTFFFLYKYMAKQKTTDQRAMNQLSQAVCNYLKNHDLDALCAKSLPASTLSIENTTSFLLPRDKRAWLARLIVWLFYEDVFASFRGCGGFLARDLCAKSEQTSEIYQHSATTLESVWGSEYPESEIIDDFENESILKFSYEFMTLYAEVNEVSRSSTRTIADMDTVEVKIKKLEERSRLLFRLTTITTRPVSRVMINADYLVAYFYALRIYKFRCFYQGNNTVITPPEVQTSLNSILRIAQRSFSSQQEDQMDERFQWPLFMAGIETSDGIHKEWIQAKLKKVRLSEAFKKILEIQDKTRSRLSMPLIRQIMCGEGSQLSVEDERLSPF